MKSRTTWALLLAMAVGVGCDQGDQGQGVTPPTGTPDGGSSGADVTGLDLQDPFANRDGGGGGTSDGGGGPGSDGASGGDGGSAEDGSSSTADGGTGTPPLPPRIETVVAGEICENTIDDDGDGMVNEGCRCRAGTSMLCYPGNPEEAGGTFCQYGTMECGADGTWGACTGAGAPRMEICNGLDDNCDGQIDEECECPSEGMTRGCYGGPTGSAGMGVCRNGTQTCGRDTMGRLRWGECDGMIVPNFEMCNGLDDDCDGQRDENCGCELGTVEPCYDGPAGTAGRGLCRAGFRRCLERADGGSDWSACYQSIVPGVDTCNGMDDNCDGRIDETCGGCRPGETRSCYTGPLGTQGRGACASGTMTCTAAMQWGECVGSRGPSDERCGNGADDNCDGRVDEGCLCPEGQGAVFRIRVPMSAPMCGLQEGDGLANMTQTCEATPCRQGQVYTEIRTGVMACTDAPPVCPAGRWPTWQRFGEWECQRGCEMVVRAGSPFGEGAFCTPRPSETPCRAGCFQMYRADLESWVCSARCAGGMGGILFNGLRLCLPCTNPPGIRIRTGD